MIELSAPDLNGNVYIVPPGAFVIMDYDLERVWVYVNESGVVDQVPARG